MSTEIPLLRRIYDELYIKRLAGGRNSKGYNYELHPFTITLFTQG